LDAGDVRAEALDAVSGVLKLDLAGPRWEAVEQVAAAMEDALAAGDLRSVRSAAETLAFPGPVRTTSLGSTPVVPPPPAVRDLLNRLVHILDGMTEGEAGSPALAEDDR
jgi:hypothetical protein